jgi:hypothetical protein
MPREHGTIGRVAETRGMTAESFRRGSVPSAPIVLRGLVAEWPARGWDLARLADHWPARAVHASGATEDPVLVQACALRPEQIAERLTKSGAGSREPPADWLIDVRREVPELLTDLPPPRVHARELSQYLIYMGRNTKTCAHYHPYQHALICQVHGLKRVLLHPPGDSPFLYPYPLGNGPMFHASQVDFLAPDLGRFPKLARTHPIETILEPGDALFIPIHWWHSVYGIGAVMSVSLFWNARAIEHRFPHPGIRNVTGALLWHVWPKIRAAARRWTEPSDRR